MFKRIFAALVTISIMSTLFCNVNAEVSEVTLNAAEIVKLYRDKYEEILSMDFENGSTEFENKTTKQNSQKVDAAHGTSYSLSGTASQYKTFDKAIEEGAVLINFDFNLPSKGSLSYIRLLSSAFTAVNAANDPNMVETFGINVSGSAGFYPNSTGWTLNGKESVALNEWHNVSVWVEVDAGKIYYCIDNKFIGDTTFKTEELVDLKGIAFAYDNRNGSGMYIDNVEIMKLDRSIFSELSKKGIEIPEALLTTVDISAKIGGIGNAIFKANEEIPSKVTVLNKLETEQNLKICMTAKTRSGSSFFEKEMVSVVEGNESIEVEFVIPGVNTYGYYDLYVDVYGAEDGEVKASDTYEFSLVNVPEDGKKNPKTSVINHVRIERMGDPAINLDMVEKAGFANARSEVSWNLYEPVAGERALPQNYADEVKRRREKGMGHLEIIAYDNTALSVGLPPVSDEELKLFAEYAVNVIGDLVDVYGDDIEVEIWNEYNNTPGHFNMIQATPEDYANMLKYTYPAIKAKYPNVFVWGLDMYKIDNAWAERVFAAGGLDYMDGVSLHPYNSNETPDTGGQIAQTAELKEIIKKYTDKDIKLLATEWGYSSMNYGAFPSKVNQGSYIVRQQVLNSAYDMYESIYWYTANDGGDMEDSLEYNFGLLKGPDSKVPYAPKPAYLAIANYNKFMTDAEFVEKIDMGDETAAYKFKLTDGRDCIVLWKIKDGRSVTALSLGTDSAIMMDMYGNETELYAYNGAFHLQYDTTPTYLIGNFSEAKESEPIFEFENDTVEIPSGDETVAKLYQYTDKKCRVEVKGNDDISLAENSEFTGDVMRMNFKSEGNPVRENDGKTYGDIGIKVYDGEHLVFTTTLDVNYVPKVEVDIAAKPKDTKNTDWWQLVFEVTNHSLSEAADVTIDIDAPAEIKSNVGEIKLSVPANSTRQSKVNLSDEYVKTKRIHLKGEIRFADGQTEKIDEEIMLYACVEAEKELVIDGKISDGEWNENAALTPSEGKYVYLTGDSYGGAEDVSGTIYTAWDKDNFYLGAKVTDDVLSDDTTHGGVFWRSDGIQIAFSPYKGSTRISQLDFAQINGECRLTVEKNPVASAIGEVGKENFDFALTRDENVTMYEIRIPWDVIFPDGYKAEKNGELAITLLINDNDGEEREGYYEYGSGMGSGSSNSAEYNSFFMLGKSLLEDLK